MYKKYEDMPVLNRSDQSTKMLLELLVKTNRSLDIIVKSIKREEAQEVEERKPADELEPGEILVLNLEEMTKKELIHEAEYRGIEVNPRDKKVDILSQIQKG